MLSIIMSGLHLNEWDDFMQLVTSVLWVENVYTGTDELIRDEVMATKSQLALRPVRVEDPLVLWNNIEAS